MKSKAEKKFGQKLQSRLDEKQNEMQRYPATFGDAAGNVVVPNFANFNYCTIGDKVIPVFNNRIPAKSGVAIWVGFDAIDSTDDKKPKKFQVLSTRSEDPSNGQGVQLGYAPGNYYRYMARNGGGISPLFLEKRAWLPLRISPTSPLSMSVHLYEGAIWSGEEFLYVASSDIDLTARIPAAAGKAAYVLLTIDDTGSVVQTKGGEVDIDVLTPAGDEFANIPAVPANTIEVLIPVRVYSGQTEIREARVNSDFAMDLRNLWHETYLTPANIEDGIVDGHTTIAPSGNAVFDALALKEATANKDATGGYAGLTLFKINFKNVANTFTSFFTNANTAARTYTFPNKDVTVAGTVDLPETSTVENDVLVGGTGGTAGQWVKKTLAEFVIILRTVLDYVFTNIDGWIPVVDTWTYASASTFTIAGNKTAIYKKGVRLQWTEATAPTTRYGTVKINSTYSAPNTTVTILVNTDYVIENEALANPKYSLSNPVDFPPSFSYTATVSYGGGTTNPTTVAQEEARYSILSNGLAYVTIIFNMTTRGSGDRTYTQFTVPFTIAKGQPLPGSTTVTGSLLSFSTFINTDNKITIYHGTMTNNGSWYAGGVFVW